jgi:hypothetical protein
VSVNNIHLCQLKAPYEEDIAQRAISSGLRFIRAVRDSFTSVELKKDTRQFLCSSTGCHLIRRSLITLYHSHNTDRSQHKCYVYYSVVSH